MNQTVLYQFRISPKGPLRVGVSGRPEQADPIIHSDTLFAALVALAAARGKPPSWLPPSDIPPGGESTDCPVQCSSLFPFYKQILFFPRPRLSVRFENPGDREASPDRKRLKRVLWVSRGALALMLNGCHKPFRPDAFSWGPDFLSLPNEHVPGALCLYRQAQTPGNVLDRVTNASDTFRRAEIIYNTPDCGLWGMLRCTEDSAEELRELLVELGRQGIGGKRSIGRGGFDLLSFEPCPPLDVPAAAHGVLLSLYRPTRKEYEAGVLAPDGIVSCELLRRGGWVWSGGDRGLRRPSVCFLPEGCIIRLLENRNVHGSLLNIRPSALRASHPVWKDGRAVLLPLTLKKEAMS